jgi:hypothetical protein
MTGVQTHGSANEEGDQGSRNAQDHRHRNAARVLAWHQQLGQPSDQETDQQRP